MNRGAKIVPLCKFHPVGLLAPAETGQFRSQQHRRKRTAQFFASGFQGPRGIVAGFVLKDFIIGECRVSETSQKMAFPGMNFAVV